MKRCQILAVCLLGLVSFSGCGSDGKTDVSKERLKAMSGGKLNDVFPAKGVVKIDGSPAAGVNLFLYRQDSVNPIKECRTDDKGNYCWSSYLSCDGLEPGTYLLAFTHIPKPKKKDGTGEDLLKGKYKDPKKNNIELKVEKLEKGAKPKSFDFDLVTK